MHEEDVALAVPWGHLAGTLAVPEGAGPFPVALLVAGSGPTDRDGNTMLLPARIDNLKLLAQALAAHGIASLRYDKRGVGGSQYPGLDEAALRFDDLVEDAVALAGWLRAQGRFGALVLLGHSEGALIATLVAARVAPQALVCVSGAGERASTLMRQQLENQLPPPLKVVALAALDALEAGRPAEDVPEDLMLLFRPSVQPYLRSWFRHHPAESLARAPAPVLLVHGAADLQVPPQQARLLQAARPDARLDLVAGMDHLLAVEGDIARGTALVAEAVRQLVDATG